MSDKFQLCPECRDRLGDEDKAALLEDYARGEVVACAGYSGWPEGPCDDHQDEDGDVINCGSDWALQGGGIPVRVHIELGSNPEDVGRILRKIARWVKRNDSHFASAATPVTRPGVRSKLQKKWQAEADAEAARQAAGGEIAIPF